MSVYFIQSGESGPIKIGFSESVATRMRGLRTSNPFLRLLTVLPGTRAQEGAFHRRFAKHRIDGEWFHPASELLSFVRSTLNITEADTLLLCPQCKAELGEPDADGLRVWCETCDCVNELRFEAYRGGTRLKWSQRSREELEAEREASTPKDAWTICKRLAYGGCTLAEAKAELEALVVSTPGSPKIDSQRAKGVK